jgi:hypothetical protein
VSRAGTLKAMSYLRITSQVLGLILMPALLFGSEVIANLLEKKGPEAQKVVTKPTISRVSELPGLPVSAKQYEFLIDHPRLSMVLAHICDPSLDLYKIKIRPDGSMHVVDPAGLAGDMELVNAIPGRRVYFIAGHFDILKMRFNGHMVLVMSYSGRPGEAGASVDSTTTSYIKLNSVVVGFLAKVMAFLFPKKVDERIGRFAHAVKRVAFAVHDDAAGAYVRLAASGEVGPRELHEFAGMFLGRAKAPELQTRPYLAACPRGLRFSTAAVSR